MANNEALGNEQVEIDQEHLSQISLLANGDARVAYNTLEIAIQIALPSSLRPKKNY